jgi:site-specific DNA recombinase
MRVVIYARYSSDLQSNRSIEDQLRDCTALCERRGWSIVDSFSDAAISGTTMRRPGLSALLELASAGRIDVVVAEALDRISRGLANTAQIHEELEEAGVRIHTISEGDVRLIDVGLKGTMNALFITELRAKIMRGQRGNIANGRTAGGLAYGYRVVKKFDDRGQPIGGLREIDEDAANVVRRIYREYISGVSPHALTAALNREGIPGPRGGRWNVSTIIGHRQRACGTLHNEIYRGVLCFNRTRKKRDKATGRQVSQIKAEDQWIRQRVEALRIVDDDTWHKAQARKLENNGGPRPNAGTQRRPKHLLSGLVRCIHCGGPYVVYNKKKLCCRNRRLGTCWNPVRVRIDWIERRVIEQLQVALLAPEAMAAFLQELHDIQNSMEADMAAGHRQAAKELATVEGKINRLVGALENEEQAPAVVLGRIRELEGRKRVLERDLDASTPPKVSRLPTDAVALYRSKIEGLATALTVDATLEERALVAETMPSLVDQILVKSLPGVRRLGQGLEIEIQGPLPAYCLSHTGELPGWVRGTALGQPERGRNEVLPRGVSMERVKGIEPSS